MPNDHLVFLSVPGLRTTDIDERRTPTLYRWANRGVIAELIPTFPCVTSCVQANMTTGATPNAHGIIANGFFDRANHDVAFWTGHNNLVGRMQAWEALKQRRPDFTSMVWHAQNIISAAADFIVTPAPRHRPDGTTELWCYSKPDDLYPQLVDSLGHFPLQHYWGPLANIESTRWILKAAAWAAARIAPNLNWIYIPHLDYAAQKYGPNGPRAQAALVELDAELAAFSNAIAETSQGDRVTYLVAGEYALTDVTTPVFPNRHLRQAGLLQVDKKDDGEHIDLARSDVFAMVDHQFAHVYVRNRDPNLIAKTVDVLRSLPGIAGIYHGDRLTRLAMIHDRVGDIVLVSEDTHWLAYYWWLDDEQAPGFARTVDIHTKPGYDPVELFFDPKTQSIPLDATLIKGSHGVPATDGKHRTALICSTPETRIRPEGPACDIQLYLFVLELLCGR